MSDSFDAVRWQKERTPQAPATPHATTESYGPTWRFLPMRVFWVIAALCLAAFVLLVLVDPGGTDDPPSGQEEQDR